MTPLARERIRFLLERHERFEIVHECVDGDEALARLADAPADIAFLDISMPGRNGVDVAQAVPARLQPRWPAAGRVTGTRRAG